MVIIAEELPIIILSFITALVVILLSLGYMYRTSFPMSFMWFISGAIFLLIFITVNAITIEFAIGNLAQDINEFYNIITTTATQTLRADNFNTHGEYASSSSSRLVGNNVNCASIPIAKSGNPDFNTPIILGIFDGTNGNIKYEFGRLNVTILTTATQYFELCNTEQIYSIVSNDVIGVRWNDGNTTDNIFTRNDQTNPYDGVISYQRAFNPTTGLWTSFTGNDMTMILSLNTGSAIQEITPINYDIKVRDNDGNYTAEPTFIGIMLLMLSLCFIMIGILIEKFN